MKQLEDFKVVGPHEGTKPRKILIGAAELETLASRLGKNDDGQTDLFAQNLQQEPVGFDFQFVRRAINAKGDRHLLSPEWT